MRAISGIAIYTNQKNSKGELSPQYSSSTSITLVSAIYLDVYAACVSLTSYFVYSVH